MAPSDANGNYSLPDGYLAITGDTILASQHNPPLEDLAESMTQRVMATGAKPMTGPLKASDGSVAAPALTFNSATSSGMYKTSNGIGFSIGGVQVAELVSGGFKTGARYIGEIFDWTGSTAPSLCVLPYGQLLSRTTYADLWAFAQVEIAAGNTLYNNGNGLTTFGVPDMRGRVRPTKDNMGGSAASRLTSTTMTADGNTLGATGGAQTHTLTLAQLPTGITVTGTVTVNSTVSDVVRAPSGVVDAIRNPNTPDSRVMNSTNASIAQITSTGSNTLTSNNTSGSAHPIVQPSIITNCALFAGA
jgi:microcystin-dependent protein